MPTDMTRRLVTLLLVLLAAACRNEAGGDEGMPISRSADVTVDRRVGSHQVVSTPSSPRTHFAGNWCDDPRELLDEGRFFQRTINRDADGRISGEYCSGGPFEEYLSASVSDDDTLTLFFDVLAGFISFMSLHDEGVLAECRGTPVGSGTLADSNTPVVTLVPNRCSCLQRATQPLRGLAEGERCAQDD